MIGKSSQAISQLQAELNFLKVDVCTSPLFANLVTYALLCIP